MYKEKTFLAIIPARGGSKRVPGKNRLDLCGKPLLSYSIEAALQSFFIDEIVVSSDDNTILEIAKKYNIKALKRPDFLATDTTTTVDTIRHVLEFYSSYDYFILLQPTSPLRKSFHIDEAVALLNKKNARAVVSVCEMEHSPLWSNTLDESCSLSHFLKEEVQQARSQDLKPYYRINGAIYICHTEQFLAENTLFLKEDSFAYIMDRESSIDIDDWIDFKIAACLLSEQEEQED